MGVIGQPQRRLEDGPLLRGDAHFTADLGPAGAGERVAVVRYVGAPLAHGRIKAIDTAEAAALPGVLAVVTADDLPPHLGPFPWDCAGFPEAMARPWLATGNVRYTGEPAAAIVAGSDAAAADAADLIRLHLTPLPPLVDPAAAAQPGAALLFPNAGTNVCFTLGEPDPAPWPADGRQDGDEVTVSFEDHNQRLAAAPIECRAGAARWEPGGELTVWATTQGPFPVRAVVAAAYGLDPERVRVISPFVGGGFGAKEALYPEILLLPWLAERAGCPVRWAEDRSFSMLNLGHGRGQHQRVALTGTPSGHLTRYRLDTVQDAGAYPRLGAVLPALTATVQCGPYRIAEASFAATAAVTTTTPVLAYRGAGQPEAVAALEAAIDRYARRIGVDPAEVRRRNLLTAADFPYRSASRATYDSGHPDVAFERALDLAVTLACAPPSTSAATAESAGSWAWAWPVSPR
jgi:carbon-monoxide dehydrogenase large subunit